MSVEGERKAAAFGIKFTPENIAYLKESGNVTGRVNDIIEKLRKGELVETGTLLEGQSGKACIQPLKYEKPSECPFRLIYPKLQEANNGLVLQEKFCLKCPHYRRDHEFFKAFLRKTAAGLNPYTPAPAAPVASKPSRLSQPRKCKFCPTMIAFEEGRHRPVDVATGQEHFCQTNDSGLPPAMTAAKPEQEVKALRVICGSCKEAISDYTEAPDALDRLLDRFLQHIKEHGRNSLTDDETRQFRILRGASA